MTESIIGVVLAGGRSSRMGMDKRGIRVRDDRDMLEHTIHILSACTERVVLSCREDSIPQIARELSLACVFDALPEGLLAPPQTTPPHLRGSVSSAVSDSSSSPGASGPTRSADNGVGPLSGMYACLQSLQAPLLVLSCDLPFMSEQVLFKLIDARNSAMRSASPPLMTTFRQTETGFIEALVAIYEPETLPLFSNAILAGVRKLNMVVPESRRHDVYYTRDEALPFFNVNYPADLALARQACKGTSL